MSQRLNRRKIDVIPEPEWADPPKARIGELLDAVVKRLAAAGLAGLPEVVRIAEAAAREAGIPDPKVTSDAKHVEIGLTDKSDSGRWIFATLGRLGVEPERVLVAGDEFGSLGGLPGSDSLMLVPEGEGAVAITVGAEPEGVPDGVIPIPGGPPAFLALLEDQLARRTRGDVPEPLLDPGWTLSVDGIDPRLERVHESLLTLADGRVGTSGTPLALHPAATPTVLAAGIYDGLGSEGALMTCPAWTQLSLWIDDEEDEVARVLDLRSGLLHEETLTSETAVRSVRFASFARPGVGVLRAQSTSGPVAAIPAPSLPPGLEGEQGRLDGIPWARLEAAGGGVATAVIDRSHHAQGRDVLERFAAYAPDPSRRPRRRRAVRAAQEAAEAGFERLLREHRAVWAERWEDADVRIEGDENLQRHVRLALFHLMASVADQGEAAVGARGLSGPAYRGHVFWDSDVFVLPFLAATHPAAARAMLEYRIRRLPHARAIANVLGRRGARFPWESAHTGYDVTPQTARDRMGNITAIRTGLIEEHIVSDVAWAASCYLDWTGDTSFLNGPGFDLFVETARYWESRVRWDRAGNAHVYGVIGPDEYHETVDDNAFTNVMARWNLRRAAELARGRPAGLRVRDPPVEGDGGRARRRLRPAHEAVRAVRGLLPARPGPARGAGAQAPDRGRPAPRRRVRPPLADPQAGGRADAPPPRARRGRAGVARSQPRVLRAAHGARQLAVAGDPRLAVRAGGPARRGRGGARSGRADGRGRPDRDLGGRPAPRDDGEPVAGAGLRVRRRPARGATSSSSTPSCPRRGASLELRLRFRGSRLRVRVSTTSLEIRAEEPTRIRLRGGTVVTVGTGRRRWSRSGQRWKETRA